MSKMANNKAVRFGRRLKAIRVRQRLTQQQVADAAFISRNYVGVLEIGKNMPSFDVIQRIATALDVYPEELTGDDARIEELRRLREEREAYAAAMSSVTKAEQFRVHQSDKATANVSFTATATGEVINQITVPDDPRMRLFLRRAGNLTDEQWDELLRILDEDDEGP